MKTATSSNMPFTMGEYVHRKQTFVLNIHVFLNSSLVAVYCITGNAWNTWKNAGSVSCELCGTV